MSKIVLGPSESLGPVPAVLVSCGDAEGGYNTLTIAWTGIINSVPPMTYVSIRPERYSYDMIKRNGDFVINIPTVDR